MTNPILPYRDAETGRTSGHSGTEASKQRARKRDGNGATAGVQANLHALASAAGVQGITIKECRQAFPDEHHGTLSGALTALHQAGRLVRLTEQRERCSVYVHPACVDGREVSKPGRRNATPVLTITPDEDIHEVGFKVAIILHSTDEVRVRMDRSQEQS